MGTVVEWEGTPPETGSPLEAAVGRDVFYLHDRTPMGVVAEVIRNDMAEPLGIVVYDEASKEVSRFKESQVEVRDDGRVLVLPSWFRDSRVKVLGRVEEMEEKVPVVSKARRRGRVLSPDEAAGAIARAPYDVQQYVDEAVVLRSELIGKLHDLLRRQQGSRTELARITAPGIFDRTPEPDRRAAVAKVRRSTRLNELTIFAIKDFLLKLETSALFPKDPRARAFFTEAELRKATGEPAAVAPPPGEEVAEFEPAPEEAPGETFEDVVEEFAPVEEMVPDFIPVQAQQPPQMTYTLPHLDSTAAPPPTPPQPPSAPTAPPFPPAPPPLPMGHAPPQADIEALPDSDDTTVRRVSLEEMTWHPPEPQRRAEPMSFPPPRYPHPAPPPPPPAAMAPPPPPPMPALEDVQAAERGTSRVEVKRKEKPKKGGGLKGMFGLGRGRREEAGRPPPPPPPTPPAGALPIEEFQPVGEVEPVSEFEPVQEAPPPQPQWGEPMPGPVTLGAVMSPPPPSIPPPPAPPPLPPPPSPYPGPPTLPPQYQPPPEAVEDFETVEEGPAEEFAPVEEEGPKVEEKPLDMERDIDKILAMALGKAPPSKSRPTAAPGVRQELSSPIDNLMTKAKYRRK